jgi:poly-gamma-glutamate synthesis protein (capsule biosynthesis protein)
LEYFAPGPENENWSGSLIQEVGEQEIATVPYNWFGGADLEAVTAEVNRLTKIADYVIVYAHWGAEYQLTPTGRQQAEAHQLVEAGADLIIGAHPHVVEPVEVYQSDSGERQGVIFYSLGNLIFDQYFSPEVKERLVVGVRLTEDRVEFNLAPLNVNVEKQLVFASEDQRVKLLERLARDSEGSEAVREGIKSGRFEVNRQ